MQIKKSRLMQIIKEELARLNEADKYADLNLNALALAAKEDPDAMDPFLERFQKQFWPFALKKSNYNKADAEDLLQDISLKILGELSNFRGDSKFKTWVFTILANKSTDKVRKTGRESLFAGGGDEETTIEKVSDASQSAQEYGSASSYVRAPVAYIPDPEQELLRKERLGGFELLLKAVEDNEIGLNNKEKVVFYNQLSDNPLSVKELAKELGFEREQSVGGVSVRARTKIKNWLDSENIDRAESQKIINSIFGGEGGIAPGALKEEGHDDPFDGYLGEPEPRRRPKIPNDLAPGLFDPDDDKYGLPTKYTDREVRNGLTHKIRGLKNLEEIIAEVVSELMNQ